jgi:hypothetical protein
MFGLFYECLAGAKIRARRLFLSTSRKYSAARRLPIPREFFDGYPRFYSSSATLAYPNRLNQRYRACIQWNEAVIQGKRILDLASHDGRWSFAAIKSGASNLVGIEARDHLVQAARTNLRECGIPETSFRFILGNVFENIDQLEPHSIDTVFCLGFFYHIANHMLLLSKIARLKPKHLILDTAIASFPGCVISVGRDDPEMEAHAVRIGPNTSRQIIVGAPSNAALELMLSNFGWTFEYYGWHQAGIHRWDTLEDYHEGERVTLRVNCAMDRIPETPERVSNHSSKLRPE